MVGGWWLDAWAEAWAGAWPEAWMEAWIKAWVVARVEARHTLQECAIQRRKGGGAHLQRGQWSALREGEQKASHFSTSASCGLPEKHAGPPG